MTPRQREVMAAVYEHGGPETRGAVYQAATALGVNRAYVRRICQAAKREAELDPGILQAMQDAGVSDPVAFKHAWIKTKDPDTGRGVSVFVKPDPIEAQADTLAEAIADAIERLALDPPQIAAPSHTDADLAVIYPRADFHLGLMSWGQETGTDWDLKIALRELGDAAGRLVGSAPAAHTAVVLGLGDFMHADDQSNQTPAHKHQLDVDGRYSKVLTAGAWLEVAKVRLALEAHQAVVYKTLPGNHDPHAARAIGLAVAMYFSGDARVTVDQSPAPRWYWRWGRNLIGATHGHTTKQPDLPLLMANERPQDWADCPYRQFLTGHLHHERTREHGGVLCRQVGSPAARDAYHAAGPWVSARTMHAIILHRDRGQIGEVRYSL